MLERWLLIILGVLLLGSIGAFLLMVPIMPVFVAVVICMGLILMFVLGFRAGNPAALRRLSAWKNKEHVILSEHKPLA